MSNQKKNAEIDALNKLVQQAKDLEITDDKCAVFSLVLVEGRIYPSIMGNAAVLTEMLKVASRNNKDFKCLLFDTVDELGGTERQQKLETELNAAAFEFNHIATIAERMVSDDVSHDRNVISNMARRCEEHIKKVIKQE